MWNEPAAIASFILVIDLPVLVYLPTTARAARSALYSESEATHTYTHTHTHTHVHTHRHTHTHTHTHTHCTVLYLLLTAKTGHVSPPGRGERDSKGILER